MTDIYIENSDSSELEEIIKNIIGQELNLGKKYLLLLTGNYVNIG